MEAKRAEAAGRPERVQAREKEGERGATRKSQRSTAERSTWQRSHRKRCGTRLLRPLLRKPKSLLSTKHMALALARLRGRNSERRRKEGEKERRTVEDRPGRGHAGDLRLAER